jgi:MFS family permease
MLETAFPSGATRLVVPLVVATALLMETLDSAVLTTAIPTIARDLGTDPIHLKLALTAYLMSLAIFIPASGWVADRYGARRVFIVAIGVFTAASALCALAQSLPQLVCARVLQGIGGAMMTPVGRIIVVRSRDKHELIDAMAWVTVPALIGPIMGPLLGGLAIA